jgi:hypothetical protein
LERDKKNALERLAMHNKCTLVKIIITC